MSIENLKPLLDNQLVILALILWELVWKGLALWKAAKNDSKYWFIAILALNTLGLVPIFYLIYTNYLVNKVKLLSSNR